MSKFNAILLLIISLFLYSCSSSNNEEEVVDPEAEQEMTLQDSEQVTEAPPAQETIEESDLLPEEIYDENAIDYSILRKRYSVSKKIAKLINDNLEETELTNKDTQPLNVSIEDLTNEEEEIVGEENPENSAANRNVEEQDRADPILINTIPSDQDTLTYMEEFLPEYQLIGRSKFISNKKINLKEIKGFARYLDSNIIAAKYFFETSLGKYIYDIVFLSGDIYSEHNFWYRNSNEAIAITTTLESLNIADLNSLVNVMTPTTPKPPTTLNDEPEAEVEDEENQEDPLDLQKKLISFRVDQTIGFWQDIHNNEIYEIREITTAPIASDPRLSKPANSKSYGAYLILESDTLPPLKLNNTLNWVNEDLKFEFQYSSGRGIYINSEKMPTLSMIRAYPAKGLIIISLPNKETRYLSPIIPDLNQNIYNEVYGEIANLTPKAGNILKQNTTPSAYSSGLPSTSNMGSVFMSWALPISIIFLAIVFL